MTGARIPCRESSGEPTWHSGYVSRLSSAETQSDCVLIVDYAVVHRHSLRTQLQVAQKSSISFRSMVFDIIAILFNSQPQLIRQ